jgi:hypothetical protein
MTFREAVIQAHIELGFSREEAELKAKASDAFLPDIAPAVSVTPVIPGRERAFIEELKLMYRKMDANPEAIQAALRTEIGKRAKKN